MSAVLKNYKGFLDTLAKQVLIGDGAMGTELQARGVPGCPDAANISSEDEVIGVHLDYLEAGSDIIQTNTFGANPLKLGLCGLGDKTEDINKNGVKAARQAINTYEKGDTSAKRHFIAGDIGPTGKMMEPSGDLKYNKALDESFLGQYIGVSFGIEEKNDSKTFQDEVVDILKSMDIENLSNTIDGKINVSFQEFKS